MRKTFAHDCDLYKKFENVKIKVCVRLNKEIKNEACYLGAFSRLNFVKLGSQNSHTVCDT